MDDNLELCDMFGNESIARTCASAMDLPPPDTKRWVARRKAVVELLKFLSSKALFAVAERLGHAARAHWGVSKTGFTRFSMSLWTTTGRSVRHTAGKPARRCDQRSTGDDDTIEPGWHFLG